MRAYFHLFSWIFCMCLFPLGLYAQRELAPLRASSKTYRDSLRKAFENTQDLQKLIKIVRASISLFEPKKINPTETAHQIEYYTELHRKQKTNPQILPYLQNGIAFYHSMFPERRITTSDYLLTSLPSIETTHDTVWIYTTAESIGNILYDLGDYPTALSYFYRIIPLLSHKDIPNEHAINLYNVMALIFQKTEKLDSAYVYFQKALNEAERRNNKAWKGIIRGNLGTFYYKQKKYKEALPLLEEDVKVSLEEKLFDNLVISLSDLARLHIDQEDYLKAKQLLGQADTIITKVAWDPLFFNVYVKYYDAKATYYEKTKDFEKGLHYKNLYVEADKQYRKHLHEIDIQRIRFRYNYEAKQRDITQLTKQNESQQMYLYLVGSGLLVVVLLIVVLAQRYYQKNVLMNKLQTQNEKINQYNEELLQNVEQISLQTKVIEEQNRELHASNQSKNKIFSLVSHDLRSPLAGLKGVVGLMKNGYLSMEELKGILPTLENNLDTTLNLTEELLYWAKSQMEGMQASPAELHPQELIQQTFATVAKMAEAKGILLQAGEAEGLPAVWADENMIKAVLRNLATNAIKFCKQGESIQISAKQVGEQTLLFEVKDTGTGMKPEVLDKMFKDEPVTTNGTAGEKGTGFGLMMCKDFIAQNAGKIGVESTWGEGSRFYFTLPTVP